MKIILVRILFIVISCMTVYSCAAPEKVAKKHFEKSVSKHEPTTARLALQRWPSKDSVSIVEKWHPGKTDTIPGEIKYVNCADSANKNKNVGVPCPPSYHRVDTSKITEHYRYEDQRKTLLFEYQKDSLSAVIRAKEQGITALQIAHEVTLSKLEAETAAKRRWMWIAIGLISYIAIRIVIKLKFPFISKFLP